MASNPGSTIKVEGLAELDRKLKAIPRELAGKNGGPLRRALFAATRPILAQAKSLAPVDTGNLARNLIAKRDRNPAASGAAERYIVTVRAKRLSRKAKAAARTASGRIDYRKAGDAFYARFVEFGTAKVAAQPFLRPAFEQNKERAVQIFRDRLGRDLDGIVRKLARSPR